MKTNVIYKENSSQEAKFRPYFSRLLTNCNLYAYGANNPVHYIDPDGKVINVVVGAALGATVASSISVLNQLATTGNVDLKELAVAAGAGAVSGALAGTGIGLAGQMIGNAIIGGMSETANILIDNNGSIEKQDLLAIAESSAIGALSGLAGGSGANANKVITNAEKQLHNKISKEIAHKGFSGLSSDTSKKAFTYFNKNAGKALKNEVSGIKKSYLPTTIQNVAKFLKDEMEDDK